MSIIKIVFDFINELRNEKRSVKNSINRVSLGILESRI